MREQTQECINVLKSWDKGEIISTIEMGGMGASYEQAIHICAFEMLRYIIDNPINFNQADDMETEYWEDYKKGRNESLWDKKSPCSNLGLSGAQAGAAGNISAMFFRHGPKKAVSMADKERRITVYNNYPTR